MIWTWMLTYCRNTEIRSRCVCTLSFTEFLLWATMTQSTPIICPCAFIGSPTWAPESGRGSAVAAADLLPHPPCGALWGEHGGQGEGARRLQQASPPPQTDQPWPQHNEDQTGEYLVFSLCLDPCVLVSTYKGTPRLFFPSAQRAESKRSR